MKRTICKITTILAVALLAAAPGAQAAKKTDAAVEKKVDATLKAMTLKEKIDLVGSDKGFSLHSMKKYGIPEVTMSNASMGICGHGSSTQYAATALGAATWNRRLMYGVGASLAQDAKARGVRIVLGPGLNIMRAPVCGRNFEYMSEDPYLTAEMGVSFINGLQASGIAATAKHFALNNMEWGRQRIDSRADERTCHEIYFPAFRAAVERAHVACVMSSRNLVNGYHSTENAWLNQRVLRKMWGFDGIVMSDSGATCSTVAAANAGLDLDRDGGKVPKHFNQDSLMSAVSSGAVTEKTIDEKVKNILRVIYRFGWDGESSNINYSEAQSAQVALRQAEEGIVLLKNDKHSLPLKKVKRIVVAGPFAEQNVAGGGSSMVKSQKSVSLLHGLKRQFPKATVNVFQDEEKVDFSIKPCDDLYQDRDGRNPGLRVEYFNNSTLGGSPLYSEVVKDINFHWGKSSPNEEILGTDYYSGRYTGYLRVPKNGEYTLMLASDEGSRMWLDDELLIDNTGDSQCEEVTLDLLASRVYSVKVEYGETDGDAFLQFGYKGSGRSDAEVPNEEVKNCDAVIVTAGFGDQLEGEGHDRAWKLPAEQVDLIKAMAAANPHVVVVLYTGGAVDMSDWASCAKAIIWAGYPGQEGGAALAEIMSGKVNPSGHLTATWGKAWEDYGCHDSFYETKGENYLNYSDGMLVGYRHFDKRHITPQYPFGYGLSYTTFAYSALSVKRVGKKCQVKVDVKNTGKVAGAEVVQVYVEPLKVAAEEPISTLRGFDKIMLKPGQKKTVTLLLDEDAFSTYKGSAKKFVVVPGKYKIKVGASSRDIRLSKEIKVDFNPQDAD